MPSGVGARLRVVEITDESAAFAGRLLADLGLEVIRVEPPDGGRMRHLAPFVNGVRDAERSLVHLYLNANKRSVVIDPAAEQSSEELRRLLETADVLIDGGHNSRSSIPDMGFADLQRSCPRLIRVSVTPFGRDGPWSNRHGSDLVAAAAGGVLFISGDPGAPPAQAPSNQSYIVAGLVAATGALVALRRRQITGRGGDVDISIQESVAMTVLQTANANFHTIDGRVPARPGIHPPVYRCRDGRWVGIRIRPDQFEGVLDWARRKGVLQRDGNDLPALQEATQGGDINTNNAVQAMIAGLARRYDASEMLEYVWALDLIALPVSRFDDLLELDHFKAIKQFRKVAQSSGAEILFPQSPFDDPERPVDLHRAPLLGEHTDEVLGALRGRQLRSTHGES
jgi:benzylsuccinate CoA-transferase BbsE subunit